MDQEIEEKLVFNAQWFQSEAAVTHDFVLNFFTKDNSLELIDSKTKKTFLRRTSVDTVCGRDLFPGSRIFVFGRKIHVTDYGNLDTKQLLGSKSQKGLLLVPDRNKAILDRIFCKISELNIKLDNCFMKRITHGDLMNTDLLNNTQLAEIKYNILNEPSIIFELSGKSMDKKLEDIQEEFPGIFGCQSEKVIEYLTKENQGLKRERSERESTLCLIKPHIVHSNRTGEIISKLCSQGFAIQNIKLCHLDRSESDAFLRVYEGVVPEFIQLSLHLASGPLIALELIVTSKSHEDVHGKLRTFCGPYDSELAKQIRPHTLRGEFGIDKICNAVHCTDLKEAAKQELDFFFG